MFYVISKNFIMLNKKNFVKEVIIKFIIFIIISNSY
jgi:hypothetical protein